MFPPAPPPVKSHFNFCQKRQFWVETRIEPLERGTSEKKWNKARVGHFFQCHVIYCSLVGRSSNFFELLMCVHGVSNLRMIHSFLG